jgi:hypothetical protein
MWWKVSILKLKMLWNGMGKTAFDAKNAKARRTRRF